MSEPHEIHPLADFVTNSAAHMERLGASGQPEVLTVDGHPRLVVQDANSYDALLDRLEKAELLASLLQGVKRMEEGKGIPLEDLETELNKRFGL